MGILGHLWSFEVILNKVELKQTLRLEKIRENAAIDETK